MPRFHDDINICGRSDSVCVSEVTRELQLKTNESFQYECWPGCFAISYDTEMSLTPLLHRSPLLAREGMMPSNAALVHIYYKENSVRSQRKEELIGFTEFLCTYSTQSQISRVSLVISFVIHLLAYRND